MANQIEWVGIPAMSLDRAIRLHSTGRGAEVEKNGYPAMTAGRTPHKGCGAGGLCAFAGDKVRPSRDGPLAHLGALHHSTERTASPPPEVNDLSGASSSCGEGCPDGAARPFSVEELTSLGNLSHVQPIVRLGTRQGQLANA